MPRSFRSDASTESTEVNSLSMEPITPNLGSSSCGNSSDDEGDEVSFKQRCSESAESGDEDLKPVSHKLIVKKPDDNHSDPSSKIEEKEPKILDGGEIEDGEIIEVPVEPQEKLVEDVTHDPPVQTEITEDAVEPVKKLDEHDSPVKSENIEVPVKPGSSVVGVIDGDSPDQSDDIVEICVVQPRRSVDEVEIIDDSPLQSDKVCVVKQDPTRDTDVEIDLGKSSTGSPATEIPELSTGKKNSKKMHKFTKNTFDESERPQEKKRRYRKRLNFPSTFKEKIYSNDYKRSSDDERNDYSNKKKVRKGKDDTKRLGYSGDSSDDGIMILEEIHHERNNPRNFEPVLAGSYRCDECNLNLNSRCTFMSHVKGKRHQKAVKSQSFHHGDSMIPAVSTAMKDQNLVQRAIGMPVNPFMKQHTDSDELETQRLYDMLTEVQLEHFYLKIRDELQVTRIRHFDYVQPEDLEHIGMKKPAARRLLDAIKAWQKSAMTRRTRNRDCYEHSDRSSRRRRFDSPSTSRDEYEPCSSRRLRFESPSTSREVYEPSSSRSRRHFDSPGTSRDDYEPKYERSSSRKRRFESPSSSPHDYGNLSKRRRVESPNTSTQDYDPARYDKLSQPDPSKPGFYCKLCDAHSNNEIMWQNHIVGKRHLANVKKAPGISPSKRRYIRAPRSTKPFLLEYLKNENPYHLPVVGLNQIREIRKPLINAVSYNCFLCSAYITELDIVDHVLSSKHRRKYLESIDHPEYDTLKQCQLSEANMDSIVAEECAKVQEEKGSGTPEVYFEKRAMEED